MEPVTHFLTGACIGRAGFNRKTAYATLAAVLAAEAADLDILWGSPAPSKSSSTIAASRIPSGPCPSSPESWSAQSRCSIFGVKSADNMPGRALLNADASIQYSKAPTAPPQPVHWGWLYLTACFAALSHILLDWTNNYGVRPFFPLNPHWYAGSFMFIAEPILYGLFFLAFFMPWVLGLADREIGARRKPFRGRGWAIFALAGMLVLGCWRWAEHAQALAVLENTNVTSEPVNRTAAEPYPVNPFRWHAILETPDFYQTAEDQHADRLHRQRSHRDVLYKPADTPAVEAAKRTLLGQVYLDWGTWAVVRDVGQEPAPGMDPPQLSPRPHLDHRRVHRSALRLYGPRYPRRINGLVRALAAHWLGLHRRRP